MSNSSSHLEGVPREVLRKVRRLDIRTKRMVNEVLQGEYHSVFKGRGMSFAEVREYAPGDDVRTIDWNVTARMDHPYVKVYEEERELTVMLMVDASASGAFGTGDRFKRDIATELCALLAYSAAGNNDKVGLILFTDRVELSIPPRKGRQHTLRLLRELLSFRPQDTQTDVAGALRYVTRLLKRKSIVFAVSDFLAPDFETPLRIASRRHDLVAITMTDPREVSFPSLGYLELEDAETGETILVDTSDAQVRQYFGLRANSLREQRAKLFASAGVDTIEVATDKSYMEPLIAFFKRRAARY